jgi:hypothetical protein
MSHALEIVGLALITWAFKTFLGNGAAEAAGGMSLLLVAQGINDGAVKAAALKVLRRPKA